GGEASMCRSLRVSAKRSVHGESRAIAGDDFVPLDGLSAGVLHRLGGKVRAGGLFVPIEGFEVIADVLLVETGLIAAGGVVVGRPEARGVGREHFVDEDPVAALPTPLELGIGDDDAAPPGQL